MSRVAIIGKQQPLVIRERIKEIYADEAYLSRVVAEGAEKARASAAATVAEVRRIMGIHKM